MDSVLTVIGGLGSSVLDGAIIEATHAGLAETGARVGSFEWLDPGLACDLPFEGTAPAAAEAAVRARLRVARVDVMAQMAAGRRKALLVADMESTIIAEELLDELAETAGIGPQVAAITARSMAGELDFTAALKERVGLLKGLPSATLEALRERITLNPGAQTLIRTLGAHGVYTALVTGGFDCFAEPVRAACGFHEARCNHLVLDGDHLTGEVAEPILGPDAKRAALDELAAARGLASAATCAVGDGANDLDMVRGSGLGVAYRAKPVLREAADACIDHGDLTALLYLQGYKREDFFQD